MELFELMQGAKSVICNIQNISECRHQEQEASPPRGLHPDHLQLRGPGGTQARCDGGEVGIVMLRFAFYGNIIISEEQRDAEYLWNLINCDKITTSNANNIKGFSFPLIIALHKGI